MSAVQVNPGRTSGTGSSRIDDHLEVRRLRRRLGGGRAAWIGLLPISLTWPLNDLSGIASIVILAFWPSCTLRDVGLVDLDFRLDDRHVGERQQHGAGVVHRADDRGLAFLDVAAGDDAVDRRLDRVPCSDRSARSRASHAPATSMRLTCSCLISCFSRSCSGRLRRLDVVLCAFSSASRVVSCCRHRSCWRVSVLLRLLQLDLRRSRSTACICSIDVRCAGPASDAVLPSTRVAQRLRVDLQQELALLDAVALVDREVDDPARRVGADLARDASVESCPTPTTIGLEIARLDDVGGDRRALCLS